MDIFKLFSEHYCNHRGYMGHTLPNGILLGEDVEQEMEGYSGYGCSYKYERPSRTWDDWQKCEEANCPFMRKLAENKKPLPLRQR